MTTERAAYVVEPGAHVGTRRSASRAREPLQEALALFEGRLPDTHPTILRVINELCGVDLRMSVPSSAYCEDAAHRAGRAMRTRNPRWRARCLRIRASARNLPAIVPQHAPTRFSRSPQQKRWERRARCGMRTIGLARLLATDRRSAARDLLRQAVGYADRTSTRAFRRRIPAFRSRVPAGQSGRVSRAWPTG